MNLTSQRAHIGAPLRGMVVIIGLVLLLAGCVLFSGEQPPTVVTATPEPVILPTNTPRPEPTPTQEKPVVSPPINFGFDLSGPPILEQYGNAPPRDFQRPPLMSFYIKSGALAPFSHQRINAGGDFDYLWEAHDIPESPGEIGEWCWVQDGFDIQQGQRYILVARYDSQLSQPSNAALTAAIWETSEGKSLQLQQDGIVNSTNQSNVWAFEVHSSDQPRLRYEVCLQIRFGMVKADFTWDSVELREVSANYADDKVLMLRD